MQRAQLRRGVSAGLMRPGPDRLLSDCRRRAWAGEAALGQTASKRRYAQVKFGRARVASCRRGRTRESKQAIGARNRQTTVPSGRGAPARSRSGRKCSCPMDVGDAACGGESWGLRGARRAMGCDAMDARRQSSVLGGGRRLLGWLGWAGAGGE